MNEKSYELIKQVLSQESVYESMKCYLKNFEQLKNSRLFKRRYWKLHYFGSYR